MSTTVEAQEKLHEALLTTFYANLHFLSQYDKDLYNKVDELSRMIEEETYIEKYALEFIQEEGDFDIYDLKNEYYLYGKKPKKAIDKLVNNVQLDEKHAICTIETQFEKRELPEIKEDFRFHMEHLTETNFLTLKDMSAYTKITHDFLEKKKKRLKSLKKFIFFGVLTGRHIPRIAKKIDSELYLVCERNLELFRLSLFTVDYTILAKNNGVIFTIMDDLPKEEKKISSFLMIQPLDSYLMKFSSTGINVHDYIDRTLTAFMGIKPTSYDYNRFLYMYIKRVSEVLKQNYSTLQIKTMKKKSDFFKDKKVLFVAAGPSLEENMDWIKQNQDKFYIVTIGGAYATLLENDIRVDMISTLDEQYHVLKQTQFKDEYISKIQPETIILASVLTDQRILKEFNQDSLFLYEVFKPFFKDNDAVLGFSVGEVTLYLLLNMNVKELYLIGLDLALNQDTGQTHTSISKSVNRQYDLSVDKKRDFFSLREGLVDVQGNMNESVKTTSLFYNSIKFVDLFLSNKSEDTQVYNLSRHGAYFVNTTPLSIKELDISDFKTLKSEQEKIVQCLFECSKRKLDKSSIESLSIELEFLKEFIQNDLAVFKGEDFQDYKTLLENLKKTVSLITEAEKFSKKSITLILKNYMFILIPYLNYHFNDIKVKNEAKKVQQIQQLMIMQIEQIINDYINFLKQLEE